MVKEASSFEKSVEMPSSFLEPSIVFDEREGVKGPAIKNTVAPYNFRPMHTKTRPKPSVLQSKISHCVQIQPKLNDSDSIIACSISDFSENKDHSICRSSRNERNQLEKKPSEDEFIFQQTSSKQSPKEEEEKVPAKKKKGQGSKVNLKDYMTQVDQNADFKNLISSTKTDKKHRKRRPKDSKHLSRSNEHGSTGGAESSLEHSAVEEMQSQNSNLIHDPTQEPIRGQDLVSQEMLNLIEEAQEQEKDPVKERSHLIQTLQGILFAMSLPDVPEEELEEKRVMLPPPNEPHKTKVIIFDLDETLVHCMEDFDPNEVDYVLPIEFPDQTIDAGLNIRPYAFECLREVNKFFQVVVFTASHP